MQMSGSCPPLSDGGKKTMTTKVPAIKVAVVEPMAAPEPKMATTHRRGGFAKHAKGGK